MLRSISKVLVGLAALAVAGSALAFSVPAGGGLKAWLSVKTVEVAVDPGSITLKAPGGDPVQGVGHFHFWLDGKLLKAGPDTSFTFKDVPAGTHEAVVDLHHNDHSPYPGEVAKFTIDVQDGQIFVSPITQAKAFTVRFKVGSNVDVVTQAPAGLLLKAPGGNAVSGEGHFHYWVDKKLGAAGPMTSFTYKGLANGDYKLWIDVHNNDHSPYPFAAQEFLVKVGSN